MTQLGIHCFSLSSFIRREMSQDVHCLVSPSCYSLCKTSRDACLKTHGDLSQSYLVCLCHSHTNGVSLQIQSVNMVSPLLSATLSISSSSSSSSAPADGSMSPVGGRGGRGEGRVGGGEGGREGGGKGGRGKGGRGKGGREGGREEIWKQGERRTQTERRHYMYNVIQLTH